MANIGPGTRFSVGWTSDVSELFGQLGTVLSGPYDWRKAVEHGYDPLTAAVLIAHHKHIPFVYWGIRLDSGHEFYLAEQLIIPFGSDNDESERSESDSRSTVK